MFSRGWRKGALGTNELRYQLIFLLAKFKNQEGKHNGKSGFLYDFSNFDKNWEWRREIVSAYVSLTLKHILQEAVSVMCWNF